MEKDQRQNSQETSDHEKTRQEVLRAITSEYMKVLVNTNSVGHFTKASLLPHVASHLREMQGVPESINDITPRFIQTLFIKNK